LLVPTTIQTKTYLLPAAKSNHHQTQSNDGIYSPLNDHRDELFVRWPREEGKILEATTFPLISVV